MQAKVADQGRGAPDRHQRRTSAAAARQVGLKPGDGPRRGLTDGEKDWPISNSEVQRGEFLAFEEKPHEELGSRVSFLGRE